MRIESFDSAQQHPVSRMASIARAAVAECHGEACPGCRRRLPIRLTTVEEPSAAWFCAACHSPITGALLKDAAMKLSDRVQLGQTNFDVSKSPPIPAALRAVIHEFVSDRSAAAPAHERRNSPRVAKQLDVAVVRLDENWTPHGLAVPAVVIDLAAHGLGMISPVGGKGTFLGIQTEHAAGRVQLLGQIVWSTEMVEGYWNVGVKFLLRFGRRAIGLDGPRGVNRGVAARECPA